MFIIDRFETEWVVVEHGRKTFNLPRALFPPGAKEGDVLKLEITIDPAATEERKKEISALAEDLFRE